MFLSTSVLISLATAALAAVPASAPADAVCILTAAECVATEVTTAASREHLLYATPAEVDCQAAVSTVALNSRADLQLESGDCSPMTSDYRFHISRLPENPAGGSLAPQRVRRPARPHAVAERSCCDGVPVPSPLASNADAPLPGALVSLPNLPPPATSWLIPSPCGMRRGRGSEPPDEPPRIG